LMTTLQIHRKTPEVSRFFSGRPANASLAMLV
jgi:hypothetical protein